MATTTNYPNCNCCSSSSSSSTSHSSSGGGSSGGGGDISTGCCRNDLPTVLYATVSSTYGCDGTYPLTYTDDGGVQKWNYNITGPSGNNENDGLGIQMMCSSVDGQSEWSVKICCPYDAFAGHGVCGGVTINSIVWSSPRKVDTELRCS